MQKDVILTPEGLEKLKQEIEHLSVTRRREVAERIKEAREFGDISENSEYDDAKNEQAMLESRIAQLEDKLRSAQVINASELDTNLVRVGSLVAGKDDKGKAFEYAIVGSTEADPANKRLSNESPVGKALIGRKKGDTVAVPDAQGRAQAHHLQDQRRLGAARSRMSGREAAAEHAQQVLIDRRRKLAELRAAGRRAVPARVRRRAADRRGQGAARGARRPARRPTSAPASPGGSPRAAARARRRSSTWSTARAGCSCMPRVDVLGEEAMARLLDLDLGDLIGADGTVFRTRRGELSLALDGFALLAKSLRPPPDKHHGLADVETRHRHRELDLIASEETRAVFITRAQGDRRDPRASSTTPASSRSRRRCCSRSTAARRRGRSSRTTTSSTATSTCGSRPSCTSSG